MARAGRDWEAMVALAMLPVGLAMGLVSALASVGLLLAALLYTALAVIFHPAWGWAAVVLWLWVSGVVMAWCTVTAVEATGGLDWRSAARVAAVWGVVTLVYPGWWIAR
jgi:hypothetical protein